MKASRNDLHRLVDEVPEDAIRERADLLDGLIRGTEPRVRRRGRPGSGLEQRIGRGCSGLSDVSENHDRYLADFELSQQTPPPR